MLCEVCSSVQQFDELSNELGRPHALTEPVVLMLIDVCRAHFYSPARSKVFVEFPEEASTDKSKVVRLLRNMYGCRDAGVNGEISIRQVMIAFGIVDCGASPCIYRHLEKRLHRQCQMVLHETATVLCC